MSSELSEALGRKLARQRVGSESSGHDKLGRFDYREDQCAQWLPAVRDS
jgi:hypothetical protein